MGRKIGRDRLERKGEEGEGRDEGSIV